MSNIIHEDVIKEYIDEIKKIDVVQDLQKMTWAFCLSTELWGKYRENPKFDFSKLVKIKYFGESNNVLSNEVSEIPMDKGGIYIYVIENSVVPCIGSYIMYVGRARKTKTENLRARAKSHFSKYSRHEENERIERVFDNWSQHVYLLYLPLDTNEEVDCLEKELIVSLTPPCNKDYPSPKIRRKLSAFSYS